MKHVLGRKGLQTTVGMPGSSNAVPLWHDSGILVVSAWPSTQTGTACCQRWSRTVLQSQERKVGPIIAIPGSKPSGSKYVNITYAGLKSIYIYVYIYIYERNAYVGA